jgi:hypothetical protein
MTDKELMQQALEKLDVIAALSEPYDVLRIQTALRERLAQPEQEPVAWADMAVRGEDKGLSWTPGHFHKTPLYTAPPKREWVGLTDGEIDILSCEMVKGDKSVNWLCKVLEAKLKEKNHG